MQTNETATATAPNARSVRLRCVLLAVCLVVVVLLVAGIVVVALNVSLRLRGQKETLPDGTRVELLGAIMGDGTFTTDNDWKRAVRKYLPAAWQKWLPDTVTVNSMNNLSNRLRVILLVTPPPGTPVGSRPGPRLRPFNVVAAEDDAGLRYYTSGGSSFQVGATGKSTYQITLGDFPRRQKTFPLYLMDMQGTLLAAFRVNNPVTGPFTDWHAPLLPQTLTNEFFTLSLQGLRKTGSDQTLRILPDWKIEAVQPGWADAVIQLQNFEDATGNLGQVLPFSEPAWKLHARVSRSRPEDFAPAEKFVLTNLEIPEPGKFVSLDCGTNLNGVKLTILAVAGAGKLSFGSDGSRLMVPPEPGVRPGGSSSSPALETWSSATPFLLIEVQNNDTNKEVLVRGQDEQGRMAMLTSIRTPSPISARGRFVVRVLPGAQSSSRTVTASFCVEQPVPVEFIVNPVEIK